MGLLDLADESVGTKKADVTADFGGDSTLLVGIGFGGCGVMQ
jgi:hypothetical protein